MALSPGARLGPYEIQSPLGSAPNGGVYRARDTRLDRPVVIRIVDADLSSSTELRERFEREARAVSALSHPSIRRLYDIGSHDGADFLVMEFLEGESLAARLRKGPMSLPEILKIGIAVADALAFAHRQGLVHRDLRPGNIMLTRDVAKLMDFDLAKPRSIALASAASDSSPAFAAAPTVSAANPLTPISSAFGIPDAVKYLSPEQIEGRELDPRSDLFSFGAVLYEMATGSPPFQGKSHISIASAILEKDPEPVSSLKPGTLPAFDHVISVCLAKNPDERFQSAADVKLELQWIATGKSLAIETPSGSLPSFRGERLAWVGSLLLVLAVGLAAFLLRPAHPSRVVRADLIPPARTALNLVRDAAGPPVLSPDGSSIAFTASGAESDSMVWVRLVHSAETHALPGTAGATFPFWSPDGHSIGFFAGGKLMVTDANGGKPQIVCDAPFGRGGAWGAGGVIVFTPEANTPLSRVSAAGGAPVGLTTLDRDRHSSHRWPFFLPDGRHFLYLAMNHYSSKSANDQVYFASVDGSENRPLLHSSSNAIYAAGFLLFARGDQLMAQPFDPSSGSLSGQPRTVLSGVMNDSTTWHMDASASDDGLLLFASGAGAEVQIVSFDRSGKQTAVIADTLANPASLAFSDQGDRVAVEFGASVADIWVFDLLHGSRTRLTSGALSSVNPAWSPDGKWVAYSVAHGSSSDIVRKRSDGSGAEEVLLPDQNGASPSDWSHDGKYIFYSYGSRDEGGVWVFSVDGDRKPRHVLDRGAYSVLSPDGRWLAYESVESGGREVYVTGFEGAKGKWQVSAHGGMLAQWRADGSELYFMDTSRNVLASSVKSVAGALQFSAPHTLVPVPAAGWSAPFALFNVSPDGKQILIPAAPPQVNQSVALLSNFPSLLR